MSLTMLEVAFPLVPVGEDAVGGSEQVLASIDRRLVERGHRSIVIACAGSRVAGQLVELPAPPAQLTFGAREQGSRLVRAAITRVLAGQHVDLMHFHGLDYISCLPRGGPPALVTLHLPLDWYPPGALQPSRPRTWLLPVSADQAARAPSGLPLLAPIPNGVRLPPPRPLHRRGFALAMGRICPEKGFDDALDACRIAEVPMLLAGCVFPWREHVEHLEREILPRLGPGRRWIGSVAGARKRRLLASARCLLVPSRAAETSCLVAMEAIAAGTPVIAYRAGALAEVVEHGVTGFLVDDIAEMAEAIHRSGEIDAQTCRQRARERFDLEDTLARYLALYERLAARSGTGRAPAREVVT